MLGGKGEFYIRLWLAPAPIKTRPSSRPLISLADCLPHQISPRSIVAGHNLPPTNPGRNKPPLLVLGLWTVWEGGPGGALMY